MIAVTSTIAIGTVFNVVLPLSPSVAILVAGGIVVAYSVAGGMWSITLTDYLQFLIMTVGIFFLLLPLSIAAAGGFSGMSEALPASYFDLTAIGWQTIFTYFLLFFFGLMIGQDIWQRVFTARSPEIARWGSVAAGVYCLLYALAGALVGNAARVIFPELATPDNAFARVASDALPVGITGLVIAAALAAVIWANELPTPLVSVEHGPKERTDGGEEVFELVVFSNYEVIEGAPYLGETGVWIGEPTWKSLDRTTVEVLVGGKI